MSPLRPLLTPRPCRSDELTDAEKKLAALKTSDQASIDSIEDKNSALRRKYERLERNYERLRQKPAIAGPIGKPGPLGPAGDAPSSPSSICALPVGFDAVI